jgi:beta-lactamase class A
MTYIRVHAGGALKEEKNALRHSLVMIASFRYNASIIMEQQKLPSNISINRSFLLVVIAAVFALGVFVGRGVWLFGTSGRGASGVGSEDFRFIRRSILQNGLNDPRKIGELRPFRYKVDALIDEKIEAGEATFVAVYFRDLENGNRFGIRENEPFSPEEQLKLPLMIAYYKWAETNPLVLRKQLAFTPAALPPEPRMLRPPHPLEAGRSYSVNELIFRMVAYGDNASYALLAGNLPPARLRRIFKDLYVNYDPAKKETAFSLSAYGAFFRVLFNASYLSEEMSEKALRALSRSSFRSGMAAGLPVNVDLASKAGERVASTGEEENGEVLQLHEFGIVYHPLRPFLLGITVRGSDEDDLAAVIRDVTELVYQEVDEQSEGRPSDEP